MKVPAHVETRARPQGGWWVFIVQSTRHFPQGSVVWRKTVRTGSLEALRFALDKAAQELTRRRRVALT